MSNFSELFKFAAKAGSLEGYLFERSEIRYSLDDWVNNINIMAKNLSSDVKDKIKGELNIVLDRIMDYGSDSLSIEQKEKISRIKLLL
ncbi:MAG: hypothetical protein SV062_06680 [Thermodesulfobacteriota bacterium]|nr:hypothetical protein [Thermodesulfobacteriota bacterium]